MAETLDTVIETLRVVLDARSKDALDRGETGLAIKWERELKVLTDRSHAKVLFDNGIKSEVFGKLAIYATQKVRRIVSMSIGAGKADPYTLTLVRNAASIGALSSNNMLASLSGCRAASGSLPVSRSNTENTANTQASSSRQALVAIGAATVEKRGLERFTIINMSHPLVIPLVDATAST